MSKEKQINIDDFGDYRLGLTSEEINEYLRCRTGRSKIKRLRKQFNKVAGINTVALGPAKQILMYRWDVKRFTDVILLHKPTYWD